MADIQVIQGRVRSLYNIPADGARTSQARVRVLAASGPDIRTIQLRVRALIRGRVNDPRVRAWTFTLDGHDYYVLRLGTAETLVYDTHAEAWYIWGSYETESWRAYNGCNWVAASAFTAEYGSSVVVGDDANGSLYFLDPDSETDDDPLTDGETNTFERVVQGQFLVKGYKAVPCYGVSLLGSIGDVPDTSLTTVNLSVSDDQGNTYTDVGDIEVTAGDTSARVHWRSLGAMRQPGRLFKITDRGALKRIDALEMGDE